MDTAKDSDLSFTANTAYQQIPNEQEKVMQYVRSTHSTVGTVLHVVLRTINSTGGAHDSHSE